MRNIDMVIHLANGKILYERLSANNDNELFKLVKQQSEEWGKNGVWSDWEKGRGMQKTYYPSHMIASITTYGEEAFGTVVD